MYAALYYLHIGTVILSGAFFLVRGLWMIGGSDMLQARWVRIAPHVIDTLLLTAAIGLAIIIQQYPFTHAWLTAKLIALVLYIVLGVFALRRGRTLTIRIACLVAAVASFAFMVSIAITRHPLGIFAAMV